MYCFDSSAAIENRSVAYFSPQASASSLGFPSELLWPALLAMPWCAEVFYVHLSALRGDNNRLPTIVNIFAAYSEEPALDERT